MSTHQYHQMTPAPILDNLDKIRDHITYLETVKATAKDFIDSIRHSSITVEFKHHVKCLCGNCETKDIQLRLENLRDLV